MAGQRDPSSTDRQDAGLPAIHVFQQLPYHPLMVRSTATPCVSNHEAIASAQAVLIRYTLRRRGLALRDAR